MKVESISSISDGSSASLEAAAVSSARAVQAAQAASGATATSGASKQTLQALGLSSLIFAPTSTAGSGRLRQDYQSLQTAIQLGDITAAEQAFSRLRFDYLRGTSSESSLNTVA